MRWIRKKDEPQDLLLWKRKFKNMHGRFPSYSDLNKSENLDEKRILKRSLIEEQGHICCYCCKPIGTENSHIEHIRPKENDGYRELSLEYENLLASCQGYSDREENCGHSKGNEFDEDLFISPLEENCESFFEFSSRGKIKAADGNQRAVYTIDKLNLDTEALNAAREAAMWASEALSDITEERCLFLLDKYENADKDGKYAGYSDAIVYHLKKRLKRLRQDKPIEEAQDV